MRLAGIFWSCVRRVKYRGEGRRKSPVYPAGFCDVSKVFGNVDGRITVIVLFWLQGYVYFE